MAIQKTKTLKNGTTGNYWKITKETADKIAMVYSCTIELFLDKAHADDSSPSLGMSKTFAKGVTKEQLAGDRTALGYDIVKEAANKPARSITTGQLIPDMKCDMDLADGTDV